jgi:lipoate-protein ligase A
MYHLPLTLETPAENLALDEALLDAAVEGELPGEVLRLWEPSNYFVVLGRSSPLAEVRQENCAADGVAVLRRPSGGATVVAGPGCLMYALVLDAGREAACRSVDLAHRFVLGRIAQALGSLAPGVSVSGTSDLTVGSFPPLAPRRKFSGNSLRLKRNHLLYHGTLLYDFPLEKLNHWLDRPARQPEYRDQRDHESFVASLNATREDLSAAMIRAWEATQPLADWPSQRTADLVASRYHSPHW